MAAITRIDLGGFASAYPGFTAKAEETVASASADIIVLCRPDDIVVVVRPDDGVVTP